MLSKEKKQALVVLLVTGSLGLLACVLFVQLVFLFFPLLITLILILVGMLCKWMFEWCVKNIHLFKIKENAEKIKDKLKVDEGVKIVKHSYKVLKKKEK